MEFMEDLEVGVVSTCNRVENVKLFIYELDSNWFPSIEIL
jgi:hypothetical protein